MGPFYLRLLAAISFVAQALAEIPQRPTEISNEVDLKYHNGLPEEIKTLLKERMKSYDPLPKRDTGSITKKDESNRVEDTTASSEIHPTESSTVKTGSSNTISLYDAACQGQIQIVMEEVQHGEDVNHHNGDGRAPLHCAAGKGYNNIINFLLDNGAFANINDNDGKTPLWEAAYYAQLDAVKLLVERGADVNHQNNNGWAALHQVSGSKPQIGIVTFLLNNGANVNILTSENKTPLYEASYYGEIEISQLLVERGADVNQGLNDGWTPLHRAAGLSGKYEIVRLLLDRGAYVNPKTSEGKTPLYEARFYNRSEIARLLEQHGGRT